MFEKLTPVQRRKLVYLILKAELNGFTTRMKQPLPGTYLQEADVYAVCVNERRVAKKIFVNIIQDPLAAPEELEAQLTLKADISKKGFFKPGRDVFWVVNFGRYDVLCVQYTQLKDLELKDADWVRKKIAQYLPNYRELRLYVSTLQSARLLPQM